MNATFGLGATRGQLALKGASSNSMGTSTPLEAASSGALPAETFDGLLASVSREILRDAPELDVATGEGAQGGGASETPRVQAKTESVNSAALQEPSSADNPQGVSPTVARDTRPLDRVLALAIPRHDSVVSMASPQAPERTSFKAPDEWSDALVELDDARHVFLPSMQGASLTVANPPVQPPPSSDRGVVPSFTPEASSTTASESIPIRPPLLDRSGAESLGLAKVTEVAPLNGGAMKDFVLEEAAVDDPGDAPKLESEPKTTTRPLMTRMDPVQLLAADATASGEPGLVSVDTLDTVDTAVSIEQQGPTPELPVRPVQLDTVRVELEPDLAVEVRTVDGEVDVSLLGSEAVKPVMKGVQAELRESLKRGGYDMGRFERSEQQDAGRRQRRRQQQHQQRRDTRRGALL